ncbi:hypothetical protein M2323_003824 [Rhodoblastus acidophilus]|uniref:extracellular catalytic domain type 2 short-chain-length polyhydroxyalkanoate depolymerase n=1 Tax=Rhodoblastus acidophilus TaxID=1074 RepID=UPI0022240AC1|nr:PHB depolymerase family esterase [Rhodoblastus acidophilus]MCW2285987.1 hypothetical protein [Rhodoblastus acidophilus]MCW2334881.1 hypothetical protein [Rhodoblastus acidophilus]
MPVTQRRLPLIATFLLSVLPAAAQAQYARLPQYRIDPAQISISGLSSGAEMTVQFGVAYASLIRGVGVIAGGPYDCAEGGATRATRVCTCIFGCATEQIDVGKLVEKTRANAAKDEIDDPGQMKRHRVWMFSGTQDKLVPQAKMDALAAYYGAFVEPAQIAYTKDLKAGHGMPTRSYGNPCDTEIDPFLNSCNYDAAGELLQWIHGELKPPSGQKLGGSFLQFDQSEFLKNPGDHSLSEDGWAYVPASCADGGRACKLHVSFHGCNQFQSHSYWNFSYPFYHNFGRRYVDHAGFNGWADANDMIVLYPQATSSTLLGNPLGCWDWWGYDDANYALKKGRQMLAVKRMIDRVSGDAKR